MKPHKTVYRKGTEVQRVLETYGRSHNWHVEEKSTADVHIGFTAQERFSMVEY